MKVTLRSIYAHHHARVKIDIWVWKLVCNGLDVCGCGVIYLKMMLRRVMRFGFSRKVALISGAPRYDPQVSEIAKTLKEVATGGEVSIVGVVADEYSDNFADIYASSSLLDNYEFQVTRPYNSYHEDIQDSRVMPYRIYTHWCNYQLVNTLEKEDFFKEVFEKDVQAVATVGNFSLALRISEKLNQYAKKFNKTRPYTALFHRQSSERTVENEEFIDFQYYNVERVRTNSSGYIFPSLCVGYTGLYRVFQHLQQFKRDHQSDLFNFENFTYEVSELVRKSRGKFRATRNIPEDKYVFYIDAGDNVNKVNFSFKAFKNGLNDFLARPHISSVARDHFEILVFLPANEKLSAAIKGKLGYLPQDIKVTLIQEADKYAALCASDFGLLHNGEATVEAAGAQLPSLVVDNMTNIHAYFNNLYNGHASPLNIATNFEGYEDLCGSLTAIGSKVGANILKHFQTPKLRFYYAKLYRDQIQKILSKSGTNPQLRVSSTGLEIGCRHLLSRAALLSELTGTEALPWYKRIEARKQVFSMI